MRLVALALLAAACSEPTHAIVLWHAYNGSERDALEASAARWNATHADAPLELVGVPFGAFADKLTSAIPNGNGPDLFVYPQDRIANFADAGSIEPIEYWVDDALADRFTDVGLATMAYDGSLYGLPLAVKSLALYYRTDLVATPPRTTDELRALTPKMRARHGFAVAYANDDLYTHAPWLFGFGGSLMDDHGTLSIATPEAARAMAFARQLVAEGSAPDHAENPLVATLFNEGKAATAISGPWFIGDIAPDVPWKVAPLPLITESGRPAMPLRGGEGLVMSARAHDKAAAFAAMAALTSDAEATERARLTHLVVPNRGARLDPHDELLATFRAQLEHTAPLPMNAAMRTVWTPYKTALAEVTSGRAEPGAKLLDVVRDVKTYTERRE